MSGPGRGRLLATKVVTDRCHRFAFAPGPRQWRRGSESDHLFLGSGRKGASNSSSCPPDRLGGAALVGRRDPLDPAAVGQRGFCRADAPSANARSATAGSTTPLTGVDRRLPRVTAPCACNMGARFPRRSRPSPGFSLRKRGRFPDARIGVARGRIGSCATVTCFV